MKLIMRRAACALLLSTGAAAPAWALQACEVDGTPVDTAIGSSTRGKTGWLRCRDADSGLLQREQELRDGAFVGRVRFYDKGRLQQEHSLNARGNKHGPAREFGPAGQVLRESSYEDGRESGLARSFHPDGSLRRAGFHAPPAGEQAFAEFLAGGKLYDIRCGSRPLLAPAVDDAALCGFGGAAPSQVELHGGDGRVRHRLRYAGGQAVRAESLHANGQPSVVEELEGGRRTERRFSPEGVKRRETAWVAGERGAVKELEQEFSERGSLVREQRWQSGEPASERSFYLNGQPRSSTEWRREGARVLRTVSQFHDSGVIESRGSYEQLARGRSLPAGSHQRFDEQGRLAAESVYDGQGRLSRERAWDAAGQLVRDDEVFEDGSRRAFAR
ncbi:toxin-antitoxin system YwqK family antitoxin [Ramlibacter tataouinensis]|uniref:Uncharacterized protein n=1 Tax=Ramlibacter tataouinensis (strain ATCC BAA-407 / DSM 14655 / LMG 21543 / TTB310) TaxID=365046 RepID=F5Y1I3_RAMTT|nr:hypothetical protein [Ramlibacter tataouinensis]AEG94767.1 Hypothetical protein Rta_36530 [Ramlibacter tataouinensis TTB310]